MKNIIKSAIAVLMMYAPIWVHAQTARVQVFDAATFNNFTNKNVCAGNNSVNPVLNVTAILNPSGSVNANIRITLQKKVGSSYQDDIQLTDATYNPAGTPSIAIWDPVEIKSDAIEIKPVANPKVSHTYTRTEGQFRFKVTYQTINIADKTIYSSPFTLVEGKAPNISITDGSNPVSNWGSVPAHHTILEGCNANPKLVVDPSQCGTNAYDLEIFEKDMQTGNAIGSVVQRALTGTEINDLLSTNGFAFNNFSDASNSISLATGKLYNIKLTYTGQGVSKSTSITMYYKDGDWDLVMRDNINDKGLELELNTDDDIYQSPDLWNKLSNTSSPNNDVHETPTYVTLSTNSNKIFARITNIGCAQSASAELRFYWTRARTGEYWKRHWLYDVSSNLYTSNRIEDPANPGTYVPLGSEITIANPTHNIPYNATSTPFTILPLNDGDTRTISFNDAPDWYPPNPAWYSAQNGSMTNNGHPIICLLARINDATSSDDPIVRENPGTQYNHILPYVRDNNNIVTRNTYVVAKPGFFIYNGGNLFNYGFGTLLVNNDDVSPITVDLCVDLDVNASSGGIFDNYGTIEIGTTDDLYNAWTAGGSVGTNVMSNQSNLITITNSNHACIENITLLPGFSEQIGLRFNYDANLLPPTNEQYIYELSQTSIDEDGLTSHGSNSLYIVDVPTEMPNPPAEEKPGNLNNIIIDSKLELSPNPADGHLDISFTDNQSDIKYVEVYNLNGQLVLSNSYDVSKASASINVSTLATGTYLVNVENSNGAIYTSKFIKK